MFSGKMFQGKFMKIQKHRKYWQLINKLHLSTMVVKTRLAIAAIPTNGW